MIEDLRRLADTHVAEAVKLRHELHRIPELAGHEVETSRLIRARLLDLPLTTLPPFLATDVVAILGGEGPNVTLRADIDALPITEETGVAYASLHPGVMHACGHDGHTAMLYGAARILCDLRGALPKGSVRFVFQPGEEVAALARDLVAAGALDNPPANFCAALHGWPGVPHGCVSTRPGAVMAESVHFRLVVTGRGGHGSMPEKAINPIHALSEIIIRLRRECPPICSVCRVGGGSSDNVIPDTAWLAGTSRSLDDETSRRIESALRTIADEVCRKEGATYTLDYQRRYPVTASSPEGAALAEAAAREALGEDRFVPMAASSLSSEDFAYFLRKAPGVYCHLGLGDHAPLHTSRFDFDDSVVKDGMLFLAALAVKALERGAFALR